MAKAPAKKRSIKEELSIFKEVASARQNSNHSQIFRNIFIDLKNKGTRCSPRGQPVIEIEDYSYTLPARVRYCNFESRKLNEEYIKREFLWYLRGNKMDLEILQYAKMWGGLVNGDGSINSNYGQYIFAKKQGQKISQFDNVIKTLVEDKDSRRASISILSRDHLVSSTKDVPCTYSLNFRIRDNKLNMSVHMRSQDAVFGMGNDAPCFSYIHEMIYVAVRDTAYPDLEMGHYHHTADSFHVYERHFEVMEKIAAGDNYIPIDTPQISTLSEVNFLKTFIHLTYGKPELAPLPKALINAVEEFPALAEMVEEKIVLSGYNFSGWLTTFKPITQEK